MYEVCEDAEKDGVSYIEVRFSPVLHTDKGMTVSQVMEAVCEGQFLAERKLGIVVRVIVCGMRFFFFFFFFFFFLFYLFCLFVCFRSPFNN